jgi:histone H2B
LPPLPTKAPAKPTEGVKASKRSAAPVDGEKKRGRKFERKLTLHTFTKSLSKSIQILVSPTRPWLSSIFEQIATKASKIAAYSKKMRISP